MWTKRLLSTILGDTKDAPIEYRLFLSTVIVGIIVSLLATVVSIILSSDLSVIIIALVALLLLSLVYYFVRFRKKYKPFVAPTIVLAFIAISIVWVMDGGINGSNLFIAFVILVLSLFIVPDKNKKYVIILFITIIIGIYLIQLYRPDLINDFASEKARWIDSLVTAIYSSLFLFFMIKYFHNSYHIERKRAKDNELKFRALSENSQDFISRYDRQYRLTYINKAGLELTGLNEEQILNKTQREVGIFSEEQCEKFEAIIGKAFETKLPQYEQYSINTPQGIVYYDWRLFPEFTSENEVESVLGVSRDITDLKLSEIELRELNTDKDRFISILGHDLKSPVYTLHSYSELLAENLEDYSAEEIRTILGQINKSTRITYQLIEDILTWTKAQSGKIPFNPQEILFSDICNNVIEVLSAGARAKDIQIAFQASDPLVIVADDNMIRTILRNLVSNAIKFSKPGGEILIQSEENSGQVRISVSDNGVGISGKDLEKLFNLSEVHSTTGTADEKGSGLGLLLCKEFVEKHGGTIWVESEEGKGSTFFFTLPTISESEAM